MRTGHGSGEKIDADLWRPVAHGEVWNGTTRYVSMTIHYAIWVKQTLTHRCHTTGVVRLDRPSLIAAREPGRDASNRHRSSRSRCYFDDVLLAPS